MSLSRASSPASLPVTRSTPFLSWVGRERRTVSCSGGRSPRVSRRSLLPIRTSSTSRTFRRPGSGLSCWWHLGEYAQPLRARAETPRATTRVSSPHSGKKALLGCAVGNALTRIEFVEARLDVSKKFQLLNQPLILRHSHQHGRAVTVLGQHQRAAAAPMQVDAPVTKTTFPASSVYTRRSQTFMTPLGARFAARSPRGFRMMMFRWPPG